MAIITDSANAEVLFRDDYSTTGSISVLNGTLVLDVHGSSSLLVTFAATAFVATGQVQGSVDGTNWFVINGILQDGTQFGVSNFTGAAAGKTAAYGVSGFKQVRVTLTAYTSGTCTAFMRVSRAQVYGNAGYTPREMPSISGAEAVAAVNTITTLTIPAPGVGLYIVITGITVYRFYSLVGIAAAAPNLVVCTNVPMITFVFGQSAAGAGTLEVQRESYKPGALATAANTAVTIAAPAQLQTIWRIRAEYYVA